MNDGMGQYVSSEVIKLMLRHDIKVNGAKILILGITFKENCPDVRNTKVVDVINGLKKFMGPRYPSTIPGHHQLR